jgi:hypothetical protein
MLDIKEIADKADLIIDGYAYKKENDCIRALNLHHPDKATVFNKDFDVIETTMDDIEISIAKKYLCENIKYMEI